MISDKTKAESEEKIDLLKERYEYAFNARLNSQQIYPLWENIYALIVGQIFIAYFTTSKPHYEYIICATGILFSFFWLVLIITNEKSSFSMMMNIQSIENDIQMEYNKIGVNHDGMYHSDRRRQYFSNYKGLIPYSIIRNRGKIPPILLILIWIALICYELFTTGVLYKFS